jgi:hypothetical protein
MAVTVNAAMPTQREQHDGAPTLRDLYPHLTDAGVADAENRFDRYIELALRIFERLAADPTYPENLRALTAERGELTMNPESVDQTENKKAI